MVRYFTNVFSLDFFGRIFERQDANLINTISVP
jgi:hypothetical protein